MVVKDEARVECLEYVVVLRPKRLEQFNIFDVFIRDFNSWIQASINYVK